MRERGRREEEDPREMEKNDDSKQRQEDKRTKKKRKKNERDRRRSISSWTFRSEEDIKKKCMDIPFSQTPASRNQQHRSPRKTFPTHLQRQYKHLLAFVAPWPIS